MEYIDAAKGYVLAGIIIGYDLLNSPSIREEYSGIYKYNNKLYAVYAHGSGNSAFYFDKYSTYANIVYI